MQFLIYARRFISLLMTWFVIVVLSCNTVMADVTQDTVLSASKDSMNNNKTPYDPTDLKAVFAVLDEKIREENQYLSKLLPACEKMETKHDVDRWIKKTLKAPLPEPKKMRKILLEEKNEISLLETERYRLEQLLISTRNKAHQECQAARQTSFATDLPKTISSSLQHRVVEAEELYEKGAKISSKVISLLSDHSRIPLPKSYHDELNAASSRLVGECGQSAVSYGRLRSSLLGNFNRKKNQSFLKIESRLKKAQELLEEAQKAGYEHRDIYQYRLEEFSKLVKKIKTGHHEMKQCNKRYDYISNACFEFSGDHRNKNTQKIMYEYKELWGGIIELRKEKLAKVKSGMQNIRMNQDQVIKAVAGAKNCLKAAQTKLPKGPSPAVVAEATATKASCDRGSNSANIAKLGKPRFSKVPGIAKKISELRRVNSALAKEAAASSDAVTAYRNGKPKLALVALNKAKVALDSISSLLHCPALKSKINTRKAKAKKLQAALRDVNSAIYRCKQVELKKVMRLYGKDTHPVVKKKMFRVREQLKLLQKFIEAGDAYRSDNIGRFVSILYQVNGQGAPLSCSRLDKKAQSKIDMIDQAKADKFQVKRFVTTCDMKALRTLQRRYRTESSVITLAKEIYESATEGIKDCKRKKRERRAKAEEEARVKAQKAKEVAEARAKAEAEARAKKAKREKEEAETKNSTASGSWKGTFESKYTVQGYTGKINAVLKFTIEKGEVRGQFGEGKRSAPIKGSVRNGHIQMLAVKNGGEGEQIKIILHGEIDNSEKVKGKGTYSQPEWGCVAEELGKALGGGNDDLRRCPNADYPAQWSAHKVEPTE